MSPRRRKRFQPIAQQQFGAAFLRARLRCLPPKRTAHDIGQRQKRRHMSLDILSLLSVVPSGLENFLIFREKSLHILLFRFRHSVSSASGAAAVSVTSTLSIRRRSKSTISKWKRP